MVRKGYSLDLWKSLNPLGRNSSIYLVRRLHVTDQVIRQVGCKALKHQRRPRSCRDGEPGLMVKLESAPIDTLDRIAFISDLDERDDSTRSVR